MEYEKKKKKTPDTVHTLIYYAFYANPETRTIHINIYIYIRNITNCVPLLNIVL